MFEINKRIYFNYISYQLIAKDQLPRPLEEVSNSCPDRDGVVIRHRQRSVELWRFGNFELHLQKTIFDFTSMDHQVLRVGVNESGSHVLEGLVQIQEARGRFLSE